MERLKQRGFPPGKQDSGIRGNTVSGREAKRKEETPEIGPVSNAMYFRATLIYVSLSSGSSVSTFMQAFLCKCS